MARLREVRLVREGVYGRWEDRVRDLTEGEKPPKEGTLKPGAEGVEAVADDAAAHNWRPVKE